MRIITGHLMLFCLLAGPAARATAQEDLTVLKPSAETTDPAKMLSAYLLGQAQLHFEARRKAVAELKTPEDLKRRQEDLKSKFIAALGGFPERTPLNAKVVGTDQRDGYRLERVIYESRPNHHVTAHFYCPNGKGPFPGVLMPNGHDLNGKSNAGSQRGCIFLAKNGIAALTYDPISQGERLQALDGQGKSATGGNTMEHTLIGVGALLVGQTTATYRIWDGMRSLDYLAGRPEVDPKSLGCTGCSGGGTLTSYLMALDERIVCAAPSCYVTSLERLFATIGPQDAEQNIPGQVAFGMEHADYLNMRAPRPTLLLTATRDFFDIQGSWTTFREAKRTYGLLGHSERVELAEFDTGHGYPKPQREAMVRWMLRWLAGKDTTVEEGEIAIGKDQDLHCTRTGQVLDDLKGKSVFDLNAERDKELAGQRAKSRATKKPEELVGEVRRLIALETPVKPARLTKVGTVERKGYAIGLLRFETDPGIAIPALFFSDRKDNKQPVILYVHGDGKAVDAGPDGPCDKLVKAGNRILALDLRGLGETAPRTSRGKWTDYFGGDWKESFLAMHINRPLLGQRVADVLAVIEFLNKYEETRDAPIHLIGIGAGGPIALHAAALEPRIGEVTVTQSVVSWSAVVRSPVSSNQLTNVVPGALKVYDLPELAGLIAPRPLTIRAVVDPVKKPVAQAALDETYSSCKAAYADKKAEKHLNLQAE